MAFAIETWPPERIEALKAMRANGVFASVIARELSAREGITITRNAVLGKVHRLGLPTLERPAATPEELQTKEAKRRNQQNAAQRNRRHRHASQKPVAFKPSFTRPPRAEKRTMHDIPALPPLNLTIDDLTFNDGRPVECRFITNEDLQNATYCGHPVDEGCSWCPHHRMILQPPKGWIAPAMAPKIAVAA